jgi:RNA polymerase sigma factor (sigma-70 family)
LRRVEAAEEPRMVIAEPSLEVVPDALLLACYLEERNEAAFTELVRRHGPVVRAACRRALGETPDADDAFQAVFLILARKAATLRNSQMLGPWLHTVAVRAAGRARLLIRRRLARERPVSTMPEPAVISPEPVDWLPLLDAEIQRLPDRYRLPLVLCELQGKSRSDAARLLRLNEGTLSSRLARGRDLLRRRLRHRGAIVASAGLTVAFLYSSEAIPSSLLAATTKAALAGTVSVSVAALTQGVLKAMLFAKLKVALIVFLTLAIGSGTLVASRYAFVRAEDRPADAKSETDKLQGSWEITSAQMNGKDVDGDEGNQIKSQKMVFTGNKVKLKHEVEYTIDPSTKPKQIDLKVDEGPEAERGTWKGIYELKGDELTLHVGAGPDADRPTEFVSKEGVRTMLFKLKRAK